MYQFIAWCKSNVRSICYNSIFVVH